eukprot:scaffold30643_cov43-Phaeocystis_antarctica.AAC.1
MGPGLGPAPGFGRRGSACAYASTYTVRPSLSPCGITSSALMPDPPCAAPRVMQCAESTSAVTAAHAALLRSSPALPGPYTGGVGAEPRVWRTSWGALTLKVGKSPTATTWLAELPVAIGDFRVRFVVEL